MAPMPKEDIDAIAEAVMAKHASGEHPVIDPGTNGTKPSKPPHKVEPAVTDSDAGGPKTWWETARVPLAATAGAILAIAGTVLTVGISWGGNATEVANIKTEVTALKAEVATKADAAAAMDREKRLRENEAATKVNAEVNSNDHAAIKKELAEQKDDVKEIRKAQIEQDKKLDRILSKLK